MHLCEQILKHNKIFCCILYSKSCGFKFYLKTAIQICWNYLTPYFIKKKWAYRGGLIFSHKNLIPNKDYFLHYLVTTFTSKKQKFCTHWSISCTPRKRNKSPTVTPPLLVPYLLKKKHFEGPFCYGPSFKAEILSPLPL